MFRKHSPVKIEIDPLAVSCKTTHVAVRLERIAENYRQLDLLLADVEARMPVAEPVLESAGGIAGTIEIRPFRPQKPR